MCCSPLISASFNFYFLIIKRPCLILSGNCLCCLELKGCPFLLLRDLTQQLMLFNVGQGWGGRCRYGSRPQRAIRGATVSARASMVRHAYMLGCGCEPVCECDMSACSSVFLRLPCTSNFTLSDGVQDSLIASSKHKESLS